MRAATLDRFDPGAIDYLDGLHDRSAADRWSSARCGNCRWGQALGMERARGRVERAFAVLEDECEVVSTVPEHEGGAMLAMAKAAALQACDVVVCTLGAVDQSGNERWRDIEAVEPDGLCECWEPA